MDVKVIETLNGGDLELKGNDIALVDGHENQAYLGTFGGAGKDGWWGNELLLKGGNDFQLSAATEQLLNELPINSANRVKVEQSIVNDLAYIKKYLKGTEITARVIIVSDIRLKISVFINGEEFKLNWNIPEPEFVPVPVYIAPPPPPMVPVYHWDNASIVSASNKLTQWDDIGQFGNSLKEFEAPSPNLLVQHNINEINNRQYVKFQGVTGENVYSLDVLQLSHTNKVTLIMVMAKAFITGSIRRMASIAEPGTTFEGFDDAFGVYYSGAAMDARITYTNPNFKGHLTSPGTDWHIYEFAFDRSDIPKTWVDGVQVAGTNLGSGSTPANFGDHFFVLGSETGAEVEFKVAEIMVFDDVLTPYDRNIINGVLQSYFGL